MSVSSAPLRRVSELDMTYGAVAGLVVSAAIAGLLLGGFVGGNGNAPAPKRPATVQTIAHEGLRLQVPSGWARADAETSLGFRRPLALRNSDETLRATVELLPATSATLLPAVMRAPESPDVVRLASGLHAWRYRLPQDDGSLSLLYAAPTTSGVATVACTGTVDATRGCEALARMITVPGSRALEPGMHAAFFSRLPATVDELDAARTRGARALSAATRSTGQAAAADGLARAHKAAGAALAPLTAEGDGAPKATVGALTATATAYSALASAARARSPRLYANAGQAVSGAEGALQRTMTTVADAAGTATRAATQPTSAPVRKPATPAASTPARKPATPAASTPAPRPATKAASAPEFKPATKAATAPEFKPATKAATAPARKPATKAATAPARKPATKAATAPGRKRATKAWPAAASAPATTAPATTAPAASKAAGPDFTLILLGLVGAFAIFVAIRAARSALL